MRARVRERERVTERQRARARNRTIARPRASERESVCVCVCICVCVSSSHMCMSVCRCVHIYRSCIHIYWTVSSRSCMGPYASTEHNAAQQIKLQYTLIYCNTLINTATHWNTLQALGLHFFGYFAGTAARYSTLQHTAILCNTLQHTETHCNTPASFRSPRPRDLHHQVASYQHHSSGCTYV